MLRAASLCQNLSDPAGLAPAPELPKIRVSFNVNVYNSHLIDRLISDITAFFIGRRSREYHPQPPKVPQEKALQVALTRFGCTRI